MKRKTPSDQRHRVPSEIISHARWLSHRGCLRMPAVEAGLAERGLFTFPNGINSLQTFKD